tara:strand:- start:700 stop:2247 length:1548 start_codon:yes stop_codon:yes gene_type:complete
MQTLEKIINKLNPELNDGNFEYVLKECLKLKETYPKSSFLDNYIGLLYKSLGQLDKAEEFFHSSLKINNNNFAALNNLANTYKVNNKIKEAIEYYHKALNLKPDYVQCLINYGQLKLKLNNHEGAIELFLKSIDLDPKKKGTWMANFNLATAYMQLNDKSNGIKYVHKTLELNPDFAFADKLISNITDYNKNDDHLYDVKSKIDQTKSNINKGIYHFILGKAYEDKKDYAESIKNILKANQILKKSLKYKVETQIENIQKVTETFKNIDFKKYQSNENKNEKFIFIVGMPRSGTSLVEQILSAHTETFGAGETTILENILKKEFYTEKFDINNSNLIKKITLNYRKNMSFFNTEKIIIDKSLLNFIWIGFIKILYPNSYVINVVRDPFENCISCFKNYFEGGLPFTYDQKDLAIFYKNYIRTVNFWKGKLGSFIYEIKYENLIENSKNEIEKLLKFCDLKYEDNCLNFHNNKNPVKTLSMIQVRQPIYKSSLNLSKKFDYKKEFSELYNELNKTP